MAFRLSGSKGGKAWRVVPAIAQLASQIEARRGGATHAADGTVSSPAHDLANPSSDHREDAEGWVRAIDIGETVPGLIDEVFEAIRLSRDPRVLYAIHDDRMFSSYPAHGHPAYSWRPYSGSNGHETHGHISVVDGPAENDTAAWQIGGDEMATPADEITEGQANTLEALHNAFGGDLLATRVSQLNRLFASLDDGGMAWTRDEIEAIGGGGAEGLTLDQILAELRRRLA